MNVEPMEIMRDEKGEIDVKGPMEVDFTGRPIEDIVLLNQYPDLRKLTWRNLPNDDLILLFTIHRNPMIQYFDVSRSVCDLRQLIQTKPPSQYMSSNLTYLNLSGTIQMTNRILRHIVKNHPHLQELNISCTGLLNVRPLAALTTLTSLNVSHNYLTDSDARDLVTRFPHLIHLDISHNDLTDQGAHEFLGHQTLQQLDVSNQHTHYITPQTIEIISTHVAQNQPQILVLMEQKAPDVTKTYFNTYEDNMIDLKLVFERFPNLTKMYIAPQSGNEDFRFIPKFKHLQELKVTTISVPFNDTIASIFKSKTIIKLELYRIRIGEKLAIANVLKRNNVLQTVTMRDCDITDEFVKILLQTKSIRDLDIGENLVNFDRIIPYILKNESLFSFYTNWDHGITKVTMDQFKILEAHLDDNKLRILTMQQVLPLIAATQLGGGALRHSAIDIIPIISHFLGLQSSGEELKALSRQIEPVTQLGKRKETEPKSLPFMFKNK